MRYENDHHQEGKHMPSKVVTIRELDKKLFEQFVSLTKTWGKNTGTIFSKILSNYLESGGSNIFMPAFEERLKELDCNYLEIVENVADLTIQKKDLISLPDDVKFHFRNIEKLVLHEDIDTTTLLKYIYRISNSIVNPPKNVEKIFFLSLLQYYSRYPIKDRKTKDVTIRNVEEQVWNDFTSFCQLNNSKVGLLVSEILWEIIPEMEITQILLSKIKEPFKNICLITSQKVVSINQRNLKEIKTKKVLFHRIDELIFQDDISNKEFVDKVVGIYNCKKVVFPKTFSKLLKLSRVQSYPTNDYSEK